MKKIDSSLENIVKDLKEFYKPKEWHFLTLNGITLNEKETEIQWIFSKYEEIDNIVVFSITVNKGDTIPSIVDIIPSAIISQREIVDMFAIEVEGSKKGLYLDEDSMQAPLGGYCER